MDPTQSAEAAVALDPARDAFFRYSSMLLDRSGSLEFIRPIMLKDPISDILRIAPYSFSSSFSLGEDNHGISAEQVQRERIHADRAVGGDSDHRRADRP